MSDYGDFVADIKEWANREDWTDALAQTFVAQATEYFNRDLRIDRMVQHDNGTIVDRQVQLPDDWLQMTLVRGPTGTPLRYKSQDEFYNLTDGRAYGYYTINGRNIVVGGTPDPSGNIVRIDYYGEIALFTGSFTNFLFTKYRAMYLLCALSFSSVHGIDDERAAGFKASVDEFVSKLNAQHLVSKASGSRVTRTRTRGFG